MVGMLWTLQTQTSINNLSSGISLHYVIQIPLFSRMIFLSFLLVQKLTFSPFDPEMPLVVVNLLASLNYIFHLVPERGFLLFPISFYPLYMRRPQSQFLSIFVPSIYPFSTYQKMQFEICCFVFQCRQSLANVSKCSESKIVTNPEGWKRRQGTASPREVSVTRPEGQEHMNCLWTVWAQNSPKNKLPVRPPHNTGEGSNTLEEAWALPHPRLLGSCPPPTLAALGRAARRLGETYPSSN